MPCGCSRNAVFISRWSLHTGGLYTQVVFTAVLAVVFGLLGIFFFQNRKGSHKADKKFVTESLTEPAIYDA